MNEPEDSPIRDESKTLDEAVSNLAKTIVQGNATLAARMADKTANLRAMLTVLLEEVARRIMPDLRSADPQASIQEVTIPPDEPTEKEIRSAICEALAIEPNCPLDCLFADIRIGRELLLILAIYPTQPQSHDTVQAAAFLSSEGARPEPVKVAPYSPTKPTSNGKRSPPSKAGSAKS